MSIDCRFEQCVHCKVSGIPAPPLCLRTYSYMRTAIGFEGYKECRMVFGKRCKHFTTKNMSDEKD